MKDSHLGEQHDCNAAALTFADFRAKPGQE